MNYENEMKACTLVIIGFTIGLCIIYSYTELSKGLLLSLLKLLVKQRK
jgi:hypothetical protein